MHVSCCTFVLVLQKDSFLTLFRDFPTPVKIFWTVARRPGETFRDFLGILGPEGLETPVNRERKKTNKHKHFRQDGVRDKQEPSLGQMGLLPGTKWDPSLGQTGLSLFNSTVRSPFCPVCPWDGWGFVPGTIVPQGPSEKCLCVFCLLVFFAPSKWPFGSQALRRNSPAKANEIAKTWHVRDLDIGTSLTPALECPR